MHPHYLSPKVQIRADLDGWGSYALEPIAAGETVAAYGGRCVTRASLDELPVNDRVRSIQIDDALFLVGDGGCGDTCGEQIRVPDDAIIHSCQPNCGIVGSVLVVAMFDIRPGESLTFDHAMCMGTDINEFECSCGAATCRIKVTGHDWMLPELQFAYRGYFSVFLAKRISALVRTGAERRPFAI